MVVFGDWLTFEASSGHSRNCGIWDFIFPLSRLLLGSSLVCLALQYSMVQCWFYQCQLTITLNCSLSLQQGDSVTHKDLSKCSDIHKMFVMSFCWTGDNRRVITVFTFICLYWAAIVVPTGFQFPVLCQLLKEGDYLELLFNYLDEQNGAFLFYFFFWVCVCRP